MDEHMPMPDDAQFLDAFEDAFERSLDKGIVEDAEVTVGLLGLDLLGINFRMVVTSGETYPAYVQTVEQDAEDTVLLDSPSEGDDTPPADVPPHQ